MLFIVDTSSLIVLEQLNWLDELCHVDDAWFCPAKVFQELKRSNELRQWLDEKNIAIIKAERLIPIATISEADAEVISLALEKSGSVLSEDKPLGQKAKKLGTSAYNVGTLVMLFFQHGRIDKNNCLQRLRILVDESFISRSLYRQLLKSITS